MKTEFVSVPSHQLRTPLTAMKWYLEELGDVESGKLNKEQKEYVESLDASLDRMIILINDLLNVSRLETARMIVEPKPTDIIKLIKRAVEGNVFGIKKKGVKIITDFKVKSLKKINIDPKLIYQVVNNLLSNAIKYSKDKNPRVKISLEKMKDEIKISIEDNGMGIPKKDQSKMFRKFFRASNAVRQETEGTGLGLYIAKMIVEVSGGRIWFKSSEGKGTIFYFTLPLAGSKPHKGETRLA